MEVLKKRMVSPSVGQWQRFLQSQSFYHGKIDKDFYTLTEKATKLFQRANKLKPDGIVGRLTRMTAVKQGLNIFTHPSPKIAPKSILYPPRPNFKPLLTLKQKTDLFGKFEYVAAPTKTNKEKIKVLKGWTSKNLVTIDIPQLALVTDGKYTRMRVHKLVAYQTKQLWAQWEKDGLLHLIKSYAGSYNARFMRGSKTSLSNHSWATAFDINVAWNGLNKEPAMVGEEGSVRELVPAAHKWGFFWGGHFRRKDGMHFEIAFIIPDPDQ